MAGLRSRIDAMFLRLAARALILATLLASPLRAAPADPSLFVGEAGVASQGEAERASALGPALLQALVRASGDPSVAADPGATAAMARAPELLRHYAYRQDLEPGPGGRPLARQVLVAQFDPEATQALLRELRRAPWVERPATLVVVVIDDGVTKRIASAAQVDALFALTRPARARGLTLKFPEMDPSDLARLDGFALWEGTPAAVMAVAARYEAQAALIARLSREGAAWRGRFTLVDALGGTDWAASAPDSNRLLVSAAEGLADRLAQRHAIPPSDRQVAQYRLAIGGIESAADYARVLETLAQTSVVDAISVAGADGERLLLDATLGVTPPRLRIILGFRNVLAFDDDVTGEPQQIALRLVR